MCKLCSFNWNVGLFCEFCCYIIRCTVGFVYNGSIAWLAWIGLFTFRTSMIDKQPKLTNIHGSFFFFTISIWCCGSGRKERETKNVIIWREKRVAIHCCKKLLLVFLWLCSLLFHTDWGRLIVHQLIVIRLFSVRLTMIWYWCFFLVGTDCFSCAVRLFQCYVEKCSSLNWFAMQLKCVELSWVVVCVCVFVWEIDQNK